MEHYKKLFMSFVYAFRGIFRTVENERNLRIHLTCIIYMISILLLTDWFILSRTDWAVLILCCGTVIGGEIVNTAIENAVNLASEEYTEYGKISKDAAAGAVLISAITAVIVGIIILFQPEAFKAMYEYFLGNPKMFLMLVLSIIPATLLFSLVYQRKRKVKNDRKIFKDIDAYR